MRNDDNNDDNGGGGTSSADDCFDVLIIGSGFAGIGLACQLELAMHNNSTNSNKKNVNETSNPAAKANEWTYVILEKALDLGGTWRDNRYPGAACDIPSALYSYSFAADDHHTGHGILGESSYSPQSVILDYIRHVSDTYRVSSHIRYNQTVCEMKYNTSSATWTVRAFSSPSQQNYTEYRAKFVVSAVGQLHHPHIPKIPGADEFANRSNSRACFHSTQIPKDFNFQTKSVAIIGSGCTAAQILPALQPICRHIHLYQRSPSWVFFKLFPTTTTTPQHGRSLVVLLTKHFSSLRWLYRQLIFQLGEGILFSAIQGQWIAQLIIRMMVMINLYCHVRDPKIRAQLTPDYPPGAKRVVFSNDYYPAFNQPNVSLHDAATNSAIAKLNATGILDTNDKHVDVDVIIYATGFIANPFLHKVKVQGVQPGQYLWQNNNNNHNSPGRCTAYLGMATHGFPNLFFLYGPNTNIGHNSILLQFEEQYKWILRVLTFMKQEQHSFQSIQVKKDVEQDFTRDIIDVRSKKLAFFAHKFETPTRFCDAQGYNQTTWVGSVAEYRDRLRHMNLEESFDFT